MIISQYHPVASFQLYLLDPLMIYMSGLAMHTIFWLTLFYRMQNLAESAYTLESSLHIPGRFASTLPESTDSFF